MVKNICVIACICIIAACGGTDKQAPVEDVKDARLAQSKNTDDFNRHFAMFLVQYYHLKDAMILTDEALAVSAAKALEAQADSLSLKDVKADSSIIEMAKGNLSSIASEAKAIQILKGIEDKRRSFQMISENMYDLVRTVGYDKEKVYHAFCPMAFDDKGAYWLSASADIKNPYFGKKMLTCGEVKDTIGLIEK